MMLWRRPELKNGKPEHNSEFFFYLSSAQNDQSMFKQSNDLICYNFCEYFSFFVVEFSRQTFQEKSWIYRLSFGMKHISASNLWEIIFFARKHFSKDFQKNLDNFFDGIFQRVQIWASKYMMRRWANCSLESMKIFKFWKKWKVKKGWKEKKKKRKKIGK